MQKIKYDKVRQLDKIVFLALGLILVALVIQMAIVYGIKNIKQEYIENVRGIAGSCSQRD